MEAIERTMTSWDGTQLFYRAWLPDDKAAEKALLLFHRGHEHSGRWQETVDSLGMDEVAIFAWDARGHGDIATHAASSCCCAGTSIGDRIFIRKYSNVFCPCLEDDIVRYQLIVFINF